MRGERKSPKKDKITEMLAEGYSISEIAEATGAHRNYISSVKTADRYEALWEWDDVTRWIKALSRIHRIDLSKIRITRKWR